MNADDDKTPNPFALIESDPGDVTPTESGEIVNTGNKELLTIVANLAASRAIFAEAAVVEARASSAAWDVIYYALRQSKTLAPPGIVRKLIEQGRAEGNALIAGAEKMVKHAHDIFRHTEMMEPWAVEKVAK